VRTGRAVPFLLIASHGNQCAIVTDAYAPCKMETDRRPIEWSQCPRLQEVTRDWDRPDAPEDPAA
jgi:hypothetical protein